MVAEHLPWIPTFRVRGRLEEAAIVIDGESKQHL